MILPPTLLSVLTSVAFVVGVLIAVTSALILDREDVTAFRRSYRRRLRAIAPLLGILLVVLLINGVARDVIPEISWIVGVNVTGYIHGLERNFVATVQSFRTRWLTTYFSFVYVYGYTFLLVFPFVAYGVLENRQFFRTLVTAYIFNYTVGLVCYTLFIAYGPRNLMPEQVQPLLYANYPEFRLLTRQVNSNTNVFPSLHTSLSVTVALLSWRTSGTYPRWCGLATFLALSVVAATMYLGIHWVTDVVAGVLLAVLSILVATRYFSHVRPGTTRQENRNRS